MSALRCGERDIAQRVPQRASEGAETGRCSRGSQRTIESAGREDRQSERESRIDQACAADGRQQSLDIAGIEVLRNHRWQSQQSRLELGLGVSD